MEEIPILGTDDYSHLVKRFMGHYDAPAYVRRARQVQEAFDQLLVRCQQQRTEWLEMVRLRLGVLHALSGSWTMLTPWLADEDQLGVLQQLHTELQPRLRLPVESTRSARKLWQALHELQDSLLRFNQRWDRFLNSVDINKVNELIDGYNRYYLLEKECAFRSPRLARQGFRPLEPLTRKRLAELLPPLPVLRLRE